MIDIIEEISNIKKLTEIIYDEPKVFEVDQVITIL